MATVAQELSTVCPPVRNSVKKLGWWLGPCLICKPNGRVVRLYLWLGVVDIDTSEAKDEAKHAFSMIECNPFMMSIYVSGKKKEKEGGGAWRRGMKGVG